MAVVWSFGNNMRNYLYSKEIEPLKKAIHYAIFFRDYTLGKDLGYDLSFIEPISDIQRRYAAVKRYFSQFGHFQQQSFEGGRESMRLENAERWNTRAIFQKKNTNAQANFNQEKDATALHRLQYRERQLSLPRNSGGQFAKITSSVLDYAKVEIPDDSVIYCDIPYEGTEGYLEKDSGGFDYERFYDWCEHQTQPVFISSYQMPDDRFDCIEEFSHRSTLSATANNLVTERIYVPKHQKERGNRAIQLSLF